MSTNLPDDARELIRHFADLPRDDRARVLALVRSLSFCRIVELYSTPWPEACFSPSTNGGAPLSGSTPRSPV